MSEIWKFLTMLFGAGKITEIAASFVLFAGIVVVSGWGVLKMVEAINKSFGSDRTGATRQQVDAIQLSMDTLRGETNTNIKEMALKIDTMLLTMNDITNTHSNIRSELGRIQYLVESVRDKRSEDVIDILIPVKLTLEHLQREIKENQDVSQETQLVVQRLHTDLSTLHGLIIGINTSRNRIK
jgi:ABC-type antimicrobial peptide transport system permease subunit